MPEYVPTTDQVRFAWADLVGKHSQEGAEEFDRWLKEHDRAISALRWEAGYWAGVSDERTAEAWGTSDAAHRENPYAD